jgi:hypothetical protein
MKSALIYQHKLMWTNMAFGGAPERRQSLPERPALESALRAKVP